MEISELDQNSEQKGTRNMKAMMNTVARGKSPQNSEGDFIHSLNRKT